MSSERNGDLGRPTADGDSGPYGSWLEIRRHAETSEPIPCPSLRAKRSNPGAAVRPSGLLAPRMLWPLDCFVARAPRNDGWVAADPIASVVMGRHLTAKRSRPEMAPQRLEKIGSARKWYGLGGLEPTRYGTRARGGPCATPADGPQERQSWKLQKKAP